MNKKKFITPSKTWGGFLRPGESPRKDLLVRTLAASELPSLESLVENSGSESAAKRGLRRWLRERRLAASDFHQKSEFMAQFSHEIRTPLYGVVGTASLLAKTPLSEEQRFYVDTLQEASRSLMQMMDEILDFARSERSSAEIICKRFSLLELSRNVLALYDGVAKSKSLELGFAIEGDLSESFLGDSERLRRVLMNLFSNALKYTSEGGVTLRWKVLQDTNTQQILRCEIEDSGSGIPEEAKTSLFQPFFRVQNQNLTTSGTGLGLSISKTLIEKLQGRIGVTKAPQQGSIFWFEIPLLKCHKEDASPVDISDKAQESLMDLSFFKILVAEDNLINQKVLSKMFEKMGIFARIVADGESFLQALEEESFDLAMIDLYMGPMSGFEVAQKIRASGQPYASIPLIAFTASTAEPDQQKWRLVGMNDCLFKPVTQDQLQAKIQQWTQKIDESLPVLDEVALEKIRAVDDAERSLMTSLGEIYSGHTGDEVDELGQLIQKGEMELSQRKAHKLKSSAAQLGARRFEKFCRLVEHEPALAPERAQKLYDHLREEYRLSCEKLMEKCQISSQL